MTTQTIQNQLVDPMAPSHKRIVEQEISGVVFEFHWTRAHVAELMSVIAGNKRNLDDTLNDGLQRLLKQTVDSSQLGLLIDILNRPGNYTIVRKLAMGMLDIVTDNKTKVGTPVCEVTGGQKRVTVPLITGEDVCALTLATDRNRYEEYIESRLAGDPDEAIYAFLNDCVKDEDQKTALRLLAYDEDNFTLPTKILSKTTRFFAQNQDTITAPKLKK
ncbi:hypothetical protein KJ966_24580 [bacterium]|nr:hypothetical protein [bacterium]